jgi:hypothetical protein
VTHPCEYVYWCPAAADNLATQRRRLIYRDTTKKSAGMGRNIDQGMQTHSVLFVDIIIAVEDLKSVTGSVLVVVRVCYSGYKRGATAVGLRMTECRVGLERRNGVT